MKRQVISTDKGPRTGLPYSQGIRHGMIVYVAGQVALDPVTGQVVAGGIREQTRQVLQNVEAILQAAGTSLAHAVECLCLLSLTSAISRRSTKSTRPSSRRTRRRARRSGGAPRPGLLVEIRTVAAMPPPARGGAPGSRPAGRRCRAASRGRRRWQRRPHRETGPRAASDGAGRARHPGRLFARPAGEAPPQAPDVLEHADDQGLAAVPQRELVPRPVRHVEPGPARHLLEITSAAPKSFVSCSRRLATWTVSPTAVR